MRNPYTTRPVAPPTREDVRVVEFLMRTGKMTAVYAMAQEYSLPSSRIDDADCTAKPGIQSSEEMQ